MSGVIGLGLLIFGVDKFSTRACLCVVISSIPDVNLHLSVFVRESAGFKQEESQDNVSNFLFQHSMFLLRCLSTIESNFVDP